MVWFICTPQRVYALNSHIETHLQSVLQEINEPTSHTIWLPIDADEALKQQALVHQTRPFSDLPRARVFTELEDETEDEWNFPLWWLGLLNTFAQGIELLLWIGLGSLLTIMLFYGYKHRAKLKREIPLLNTTHPQQLVTITHPPQRPQNLDDVGQQAWSLWQQEQAEAALSLLYRASLQHLNQHAQIQIASSDTEIECLQRLQNQATIQAQAELSQYCNQLIETWQYVAYAQHLPPSDKVNKLCQQWSQLFASNDARS
jgi:hypothetical protein